MAEDFERYSEIRNGELIRYYGNETDLTVPDNVTIIASGAFRGCKKLTNVTLGKRVTSIHDGAFADCRRLRQITFPAGLKEVGERAFFALRVARGGFPAENGFHGRKFRV